MRRIRILPALLLALLGRGSPARGQEAGSGTDVTAGELLAHVRTLASDELEGRGSGTPGEVRATAYVAEDLARLGLEPAGIDGTFFQPVEMTGAFRAKPGCDLVYESGERIELALDREWLPLSASGDGEVLGEPVFAGYGIRAPELSYDDYKDLDVQDKVVVVFRHAPRGPWWQDERARMRHAPLVAKLRHAAERGAKALLVANDPGTFRGAGGPAGERPDAPERGDIGGSPAKIPYAHLTLAAAERLFPAAFGATPKEIEDRIHGEEGARPASRVGKGTLRLKVETEREKLVGRNVCALLRAGAPDATDEVVVLGAHHDHLGRGGRGSLARSPAEAREIHNGADDNASGVAGVLEAAEYLASRRASLRRSVLFLTFTGEERGLLGSQHFVDHATLPLTRVAAMVNLDMIGRLEGRKLFVGGVRTSPAFPPLLDAVTKELGLAVALGDGGRAPSDNTSFYEKQIPVLFLFSGMHPDYHRPTDDTERIDAPGMEKAARLAARVVEELASLPGRPVFVRADAGGMPARGVLGIRPEPAEGGVGIARMAPGAPAARAGLREGDVITSIAGIPTPGPAALQEAMLAREPGERVKVKARRGGEEVEVEVELGRG